MTHAIRLEELRAALDAETISYGELVELQGMVEHIAPDDMQLLEAAGVPEDDASAFSAAWAELGAGPVDQYGGEND